MNNMNKQKFCKKCNRLTEHIRRGFGELGSMCGNAREDCLECQKREMVGIPA